jgi:hypothetical protein
VCTGDGCVNVGHKVGRCLKQLLSEDRHPSQSNVAREVVGATRSDIAPSEGECGVWEAGNAGWPSRCWEHVTAICPLSLPPGDPMHEDVDYGRRHPCDRYTLSPGSWSNPNAMCGSKTLPVAFHQK